MKVLVLNCGSSSLKFAVFQDRKQIASGSAENLQAPQGLFKASTGDQKIQQEFASPSHLTALQQIDGFLTDHGLSEGGFDAIGHRVVHGGEKFSGSVLLNDEILQVVEECVPLAPLHNPANIQGIREAMRLYPGVPQVGVFDTAFHQTIPPEAYLYGLPIELYTEHKIRRYGFHGTSHRYVCAEAARRLNIPEDEICLITAHLGNGSSATAIRNGKSVDTTMGMTPLEGLIMGTRSGTIDPGLFSYLHKQLNMSVEDIDTMLNKKSGLIGLSQTSNDMRTVEAAASENPLAAQTIEVLCHSLAKHIGMLAVSLPRIDALVFTGGIGENSPLVRQKTICKLGTLGFHCDEAQNADNGGESGMISTAESAKVLVIPTDEELLIALDSEEATRALKP